MIFLSLSLVFTVGQMYYNNIHEWYRNRIEQIVDVVKSHRMFAPRVYQGSYHHLVPLVTIVCMHLNCECANALRRTAHGSMHIKNNIF